MADRNQHCKACEGAGMLADDEGWQYSCPVCGGAGSVAENDTTKIMEVDENNRLLD